MNKLLATVVKQNASDLHCTVGRPPTIRLHGDLVALNTKDLEPEDTLSLMKSIAPERNQQELQECGSTDFGFAFGDVARFRVACFKQRGHTAIVLRLIPTKFFSFEELGLPPQVKDLLYRPRGMVLITGPTGSGKTTTLATMIDFINRNRDCHIITIEDPIEYYHQHIKSILSQREIGVDVPSFAEGLRRALRQDPDVMLVGEMRDLETMEAAITAAETGHIVFATLHTNSAEGTINRIVDAFPENQQEMIRTQLSVALIAVISQQLLKRANGKGRVAAYEILMMTPAIANLVRESKTYRIDSAIQTGRKLGMMLLDDNLCELYARGVITEEACIHRSRKVDYVREKVNRIKAEMAEATGAGAGMGPPANTAAGS